MVLKIENDSVERNILIPFYELPKYEMNEEQKNISEYLIGLDSSKLNTYFATQCAYSWQVAQIEERIKVKLKVNIDRRVQLMIWALSDGKIAVSIIYIYFLQYWSKQNEINNIGIEDFLMSIFKDGFPDVSDIKAIWFGQKIGYQMRLGQKVGSDNLIDIDDAAKSLF